MFFRNFYAIPNFIKKKSNTKKQRFISKPFHYISSDGFHIYVGKNNYQNEELTFKVATGNDWWFHAKKRPGSHVIVKSENKELPDSTFEEAARLAEQAYIPHLTLKITLDENYYWPEEACEKITGTAGRICHISHKLFHDDRFRYFRYRESGIADID